jgi:hypothetical protein
MKTLWATPSSSRGCFRGATALPGPFSAACVTICAASTDASSTYAILSPVLGSSPLRTSRTSRSARGMASKPHRKRAKDSRRAPSAAVSGTRLTNTWRAAALQTSFPLSCSVNTTGGASPSSEDARFADPDRVTSPGSGRFPGTVAPRESGPDWPLVGLVGVSWRIVGTGSNWLLKDL